MKHFIIFALLLITIYSQAQTIDISKDKKDTISYSKLTGETYIEKKGYKGEQNFNKVWMQSDILLCTGEMVLGEKVKYNGLIDQLIWGNATLNQQIKLDKQLVNEFWLLDDKNQTTHFKKISVNNSPTSNHQSDFFAELMVKGNLSLYVQRKISIVDIDNIVVDGTLCRIETIKATPMYYLKLPIDNYVFLEKIRPKSFKQLFPTQKKQIDKLMKENHMKLRDENDLINLIKLLNTQEP
ncbi:MAG: hypothetical protein H6Q18_135 [Bacteroidetes bacterium]|nr:hypothetical protein [Bacteroidota bacterium]